MSDSQQLVEKFEVILTLVESLRADVAKHAAGNKTAGLRVRRGLRDVKKLSADLVRESVELSK